MNHYKKADTACIYGTSQFGRQVYIAQGAVVRSVSNGIAIGNQSMILENCVIAGHPDIPVAIGAKTVFGHRCIVIGASIGNLCEIGNNSIIMPGSTIGNWCILGEGTLIEPAARIPDFSVVVGRPGKIIRSLTPKDRAMIIRMRNGDTSISQSAYQAILNVIREGSPMGKLYAYKEKSPQVSASAFLFESSEITGDVTVGENTIIGAGVKIIGDSHGPVRIGRNVQILENTVLHLLPDNQLIIEDDVVIGPGCMIHGCRIGAQTIVEPGAIVCDYSKIGKKSRVKAGALVKQRSDFPNCSVVDGFPAKPIERLSKPPAFPKWAFRPEDLQSLKAI